MLLIHQLLLMWMYGLVSVALVVCAGVLLYRALHVPKKTVVVPIQTRNDGMGHVASEPIRPSGASRQFTPGNLVALALLLLLGPFVAHHLFLLLMPSDRNSTELGNPETQEIAQPDGTKLHVEVSGRSDGPVLVLTHGWSLDTREWNYVRRDLSGRFRLITWDLPGLGFSDQPNDRDFSLDRMAADLGAVLKLAGKPVVLVGHSIGGMINLTYCRQHPEQLGREIAGLIELNTTYTDPVKTTKSSNFDTAMQRPLYEPLLRVTIALSPLVRALNWLSYQNGFAHIMASSSFTGTETREQLDYAARRNYEASPAVVARGMLGMFHWDATPVLPQVRTQTLIIAGEQDTTTVPAASRFMRDTMPASELQTVDHAAHLGVLEQNRRYNDEIRRFAETCLGRNVGK